MAVLRPTSTADACAALADHPGAIPLAGGTDLMVEVNAGRRLPDVVVSLAAVEDLGGWYLVDADEGPPVVRIGATTTYTALMDAGLARLVPSLAQAARTVGSPQIRNAGTIGGNVATGSPAGDTLPVLTALDATVELASVGGTRTLPVVELVTGPKRTALEPGELVAAVHVPVLRGPQEFLKVGTRSAMVISVVSLAAVADLDARSVGLAAGAASARPGRATDAEELAAAVCDWDGLAAGDPTPPGREDLARIGELVRGAVAPIDDHRSTADYRRHAVGVLAARALARLFAPAADTRGSSAA
ncbi:FAD binding domain-containing protein [Dermatobacter hominis]|uniref:FAD binding domain-containing protein n=1 Tax=Dermatobacter hominis TaxID=2884263 RepID=UPI001D1029CB|nr:FAD binding domain-containing protein [Dermatobacter hominis]UDY35486.1 FAD binding domain-containing protein [Dermatobacter hominis]